MVGLRASLADVRTDKAELERRLAAVEAEVSVPTLVMLSVIHNQIVPFPGSV